MKLTRFGAISWNRPLMMIIGFTYKNGFRGIRSKNKMQIQFPNLLFQWFEINEWALNPNLNDWSWASSARIKISLNLDFLGNCWILSLDQSVVTKARLRPKWRLVHILFQEDASLAKCPPFLSMESQGKRKKN